MCMCYFRMLQCMELVGVHRDRYYYDTLQEALQAIALDGVRCVVSWVLQCLYRSVKDGG